MSNDIRKGFRLRIFVAFILTFSFVLSALSGIILFLRPEGSLASWTGWSVLGLDKKQWEGFHSVFVFLFLISCMVHLIYNWPVLESYFRKRKERPWGFLKYLASFREFIAAMLLVGLILWGSLEKWSPVPWIVNLRSAFKSGRSIVSMQPPVAEAEKLTLAELSHLLGVNESQFLSAASRSKIQIENIEQTLADVARQNGLSPEETFIRLQIQLTLPVPE